MRRLLSAILVLVFVGGCAVGPNYKQPPVNVPDVYRDVQGPPSPPATLADQPWWEIFHDPVLNGLIDEALRSGYDPQLAAARVEEARARAGIAKSEFFPSVGYGGGWSRGRGSSQIFPFAGATGNQISANVNFGWELDIWGRIRRLNEAARAQFFASEAARRGVLLSLISDVATSYFVLRGLDAQLVIANDTVASFQETYNLFNRKLQEGAASALETSYAAAALAQVAANVPEIQRQIEATENTLNLLLGRNPGPIPRGAAVDQQPVPPEIPAGLPSTLLQRRPDVAEAEQNLVAFNANVGVATANFFPTISLTGLFGAVSPSLDSFYPAGKTWSIAAGLVGPIFQGGRLHSEYDVAYAQWDQARIQYERTVTAAFAETTTVLYARQQIAASLDELTRTAEQYREMVRLSTMRYNSGLSNYFEVLYAMQLLYPAELSLVISHVNLLNDYVAIYKALGGGWNIETPNWTMPSAQPGAANP